MSVLSCYGALIHALTYLAMQRVTIELVRFKVQILATITCKHVDRKQLHGVDRKQLNKCSSCHASPQKELHGCTLTSASLISPLVQEKNAGVDGCLNP